MRKVRHKNVVQFIGACTKKPNLCIVFEFMPCGSMYDHLRKVTISLPCPDPANSHLSASTRSLEQQLVRGNACT